MSMFKSWNNPYSVVPDAEEGHIEENNTHSRKPLPLITLIIVYAVLLFITSAVIGQVFKDFALAWNAPEASQQKCHNPGLRKEWRALSRKTQQSYIKAFQCFSSLPNPYGSNGTLYDEYSRVHRSIGSLSHESASFLPWHRYFLHIYEKTLKTECNFEGSVPYWDWTLDCEAFSKSPIWDSCTGFGGNGNITTGTSVGDGNCVTDGPFSMLRPVYYNQSYNPHCLSRGFGRGNDSEKTLSHYFDPIAIESLLSQETYGGFRAQLEGKIHDSIHRLVGGDFRAWTAPNDPIFFLHHAQLDRLWGLWQQVQPNNRTFEYTGHHMLNSTGNASLKDRLFMDTLAVDVSVEDVMSIQGKDLCYDYF